MDFFQDCWFFCYSCYMIWDKPIYCQISGSRLVRSFFLLGFTILAGCTAVLVWAQGLQILFRHSINFGFLLCAFLFLGAFNLYVIFCAAISGNICVQTAAAKTYDKGMYALCRHPGVLWFTGFYCCLWLALGGARCFG